VGTSSDRSPKVTLHYSHSAHYCLTVYRLVCSVGRTMLWRGRTVRAAGRWALAAALLGGVSSCGNSSRTSTAPSGPVPLGVSLSPLPPSPNLMPLAGHPLNGDSRCSFVSPPGGSISSVDLKCSDEPSDAAHEGSAVSGGSAAGPNNCTSIDHGYMCSYANGTLELSAVAPSLSQARNRLRAMATQIAALEPPGFPLGGGTRISGDDQVV
jgi:hypothetical protein